MVDPVKPTAAESLVLWRRRQNFNQFEAAAELNVTVEQIRTWEAGEQAGRKPPQRYLGKLKTYEICYLLRRREGILQKDLAKVLQCSRVWVMKMEGGSAPVDLLKSYWGV